MFYKLIFLSTIFPISLSLFSSFLEYSLDVFSGITSSIVIFWVLGFKTSEASTCFFPRYSIVSLCFSKAFPKEEYVNLAGSIILLWSNRNIYSPVWCSYLSIFPDDNADIFAASLLI